MLEELLKNTCFSFHLIIVQCDPSETCSGHGTCQEDGSCKCSYGFYGDSCSSKSIYYLGWFWASLAVQSSWILWVEICSEYIIMFHIVFLFFEIITLCWSKCAFFCVRAHCVTDKNILVIIVISSIHSILWSWNNMQW